ncbi:hypothetical protein AB0K12_28180 [Nonomuraea sp. NPDC049419]|uniref:hypothetical protein n=1 Tax=Nonomuraea sp. NPDC049419 TaxID=3155772 RepID=UPI0034323F3E
MNAESQLRELEAQAMAARNAEQSRSAAFLFERARGVALDMGLAGRAFDLGIRAAEAHGVAGDRLRGLTLLTELLAEVPADASRWAIYSASHQRVEFHLYDTEEPDYRRIDKLIDNLDALGAELGWPADRNRDIPYHRSRLLTYQGRWAESLEWAEVAWARQPGEGIDPSWIASSAATRALNLGDVAAAKRWLALIQSDHWPKYAQTARSAIRLCVALWENDGSGAVAALLQAEEGERSRQREARAGLMEPGISALLVSGSYGDPLDPRHPANMRHASFPKGYLRVPYQAYLWHCSKARIRLAGLRYAVGMAPVDDCYYRKSQELVPRASARLPAEINSRVRTAQQACDDLQLVADRLDNAFDCSFRREGVAMLRGRIQEIADNCAL